MALDTTSSRTRSITAIGAGAVLFAVIGYFLLNKKGKKAKTSLEMHPPKDHLDQTVEDKCLHSPVEASSPVIPEQKFFTENFEISIEKSIETKLVVNQPELSPSSTSSELSSESANLSNVEKVMEPKEVKVKPESKKAEPVAKSKKSKAKQAKNSEAKAESGEKIFEDLVVYEFNFPRKLCGKLIGKNGVHVDLIRSKTRTQIAVRNDPNVEEQQIVCVSGLVEDVDQALDIIRSRFPAKHYAQISFKPATKPIIYRRYNPHASVFSSAKVLVAPDMYVDVKSMPRSEDLVDVHVSAVVGPTHVFIQLPKHQSFANLLKLDQNMVAVYSSDESTPVMVEPIEHGAICAAPTLYGWHRAMVTQYLSRSQMVELNADYSEQCGMATIKFLDYGGYLDLPCDQLRQLRSDFMVLPFQALECYLDGVCAYEGSEEISKQYLTDLVRSASLKAKVCESYNGMVGVRLFLYNDLYDGLDINNDLITNNYACNYSINETETFNESQALQQSA